MSETLMLVSNPYEGERRAGTVGRPLPGVSVRLVTPTGAPAHPLTWAASRCAGRMSSGVLAQRGGDGGGLRRRLVQDRRSGANV